MTSSFLPALADASDYPPARVPMTPYLRCTGLAGRSLAAEVYGVPTRTLRLTVSGRAALGRLAVQLQLGPGDRVVLPAYHCPSMVEPFMYAGCELDFYRLDANLDPLTEDFKRCLALPTRVVVFVNYFGFPAHIHSCAALAREHGASIVHDCAHAFYALPDVPAQDFAIASLVKFFAVEEGGLLLAPLGTEPLDARRRAGVRRNLQLFSRALGRARAANSPARATRPRANARATGPAANRAATTSYRYFEPRCVDQQLSFYTRTLLKLLAAERAAARRRQNYAQLVAVLKPRSDLALLRESLPEGVVPYVLPLLLHDASAQFDAIRSAGIPLYRWEELIPTVCPISSQYRTRLVQLPCHQDLSERHMDWLGATLCRSLDRV